jgi:hypothetical protein
VAHRAETERVYSLAQQSHSYTAFRHHLDEVTRAELECQMPPHAQNDDLLVKMPSLEEILC